MHHAQVCLVRRRPDRVQVRVVEREAQRRVDEHPARPRRAGPCLDLANRLFDRLRRDGDQRLQPVGGGLRRFVDEAVRGPDELHVHLGVLVPGERPRHHQFDVHALLVHILQARRDVVVLGPVSRVLLAHELLEAPLVALHGPGVAQPAGLVAAPPAGAVAKPEPVAVRRLQGLSRAAEAHRRHFELRQTLLHRLG